MLEKLCSLALENRLFSNATPHGVTPAPSRWLLGHPDSALGCLSSRPGPTTSPQTSRVLSERKGPRGDHWLRSKPGKQPGVELMIPRAHRGAQQGCPASIHALHSAMQPAPRKVPESRPPPVHSEWGQGSARAGYSGFATRSNAESVPSSEPGQLSRLPSASITPT